MLGPHRPALHRHCYRMLGEVHDADDALQETMTRAWRQLPAFEPRAPLRAGLYRIATNVCLTQLERRGRRRAAESPLESAHDPLDGALMHLTPYAQPDELRGGAAGTDPPSAWPRTRRFNSRSSPRASCSRRASARFSCCATSRLLCERGGDNARDDGPRRQQRPPARAVDTRARTRREPPRRPHDPLSASVERELASRFARAWQETAIGGIVRLLADDALMTMPPEPVRVCGERGIGAFLVSGPLSDPARRFESHLTRLNGQPAIALYRGAEVGAFRPYGVLVLSIRGKSIASITRFAGPGLFQRLDLPPAATETLRRRSG